MSVPGYYIVQMSLLSYTLKVYSSLFLPLFICLFFLFEVSPFYPFFLVLFVFYVRVDTERTNDRKYVYLPPLFRFILSLVLYTFVRL